MKRMITKAVAVAGLALTLAGAASGVVGDAPVVGVPKASAHTPTCNPADQGHSHYHMGTLHRDSYYVSSITRGYYTTKVVWQVQPHYTYYAAYCS